MGVLIRFRDKLIDKRQADLKIGKPVERTDFLQTFIDARIEDDMPLPDQVIRAELLIVLIAGANTVASVFQAFIQYIVMNPDMHKRLTQEIDSAIQKGLISKTPRYGEVTQHLPYYSACLYESMRLSPPSSTIFPRYVSDPVTDICGKFVPPGTEVSANAWILHRDRKLYGEYVEEFIPERWLDPERAKLYKKYNLTFVYGARGCLGKDIALMELFKAPLQVSLLTSFEAFILR